MISLTFNAAEASAPEATNHQPDIYSMQLSLSQGVLESWGTKAANSRPTAPDQSTIIHWASQSNHQPAEASATEATNQQPDIYSMQLSLSQGVPESRGTIAANSQPTAPDQSTIIHRASQSNHQPDIHSTQTSRSQEAPESRGTVNANSSS